MSTNKSTEESLGLVPAAKKWFDNLPIYDSNRFGCEYCGTYGPLDSDEIVFIWTKEVVNPWFDGNRSHESFDRKNKLSWHYFNLSDFRLLTPDQRAEIYLKEHTVKEEGDLVPDLRKMALAWWDEQTMEYKDSIDWPEVMGLDYGHCIEVLFSKEGTKTTHL